MKKWTVQDRFGNEIYLTEERWHHILEALILSSLMSYCRITITSSSWSFSKPNSTIQEITYKIILWLRDGQSILCRKGENMSDLKLHRSETTDENGQIIRLVYDENEDMLDIFFGENEPATGIELTDHILLRINQKTGRSVSLTLLHFSILTEQTEYGPRSYPLTKLMELPEDIQELVVRAIITIPVNKFLKISFFQETPTKRVPLTYVEPHRFAFVA
jgi:hypothetical protein